LPQNATDEAAIKYILDSIQVDHPMRAAMELQIDPLRELLVR